jgi:DNA-3-methyladenine glycosylase
MSVTSTATGPRDPPAAGAAALRPLPHEWYERPVTELAPALLGRSLVRVTPEGLVVARIVETEAYGGAEDRASHARAGRTRRTEPMFGPAGHAYVYRIYGLHWCLNVVGETDGAAGAVLVRAAEPVTGAALMRARRGRPADRDPRLAAGPARLCQALAIDGSLDGHDLTLGTHVWVAGEGLAPDEPVIAGPRVGVAYAGSDWAARPWRFGIAGHPALSRPFPR